MSDADNALNTQGHPGPEGEVQQPVWPRLTDDFKSIHDIDNRFGFHKATETTGPMHGELRRDFKDFAEHLNQVLPPGRAKAETFTLLETAAMWANKAIAELAPLDTEKAPEEKN